MNGPWSMSSPSGPLPGVVSSNRSRVIGAVATKSQVNAATRRMNVPSANVCVSALGPCPA